MFAATGGRPFDTAMPSVILLHGAGTDHTVWSMQARYLAHHGRSLVAVDFPGHGRSQGEALRTIGALADWVVRLLDAARVETAALAGHSMGAFAALEAAARVPDRIRALALLAAGATMPVHPELLEAARSGQHLAIELITAWGYDRVAHRGGHPSPGLWMMDGSGRLLERGRPGVLHTDLKACDDYGGALEAAAKVRCPALLLIGEGDRMTPPVKGRLGGSLKNSRTVVLRRCGHMMMIEQPNATTDALRQIL